MGGTYRVQRQPFVCGHGLNVLIIQRKLTRKVRLRITDMDEHPEGHNGNSHQSIGISIALLAIPILYVVLLGPVVRVYDSCPEPVQTGLEYIYSPLEWLDERIPGNPFSKYVEMWEQ